MELLPSRVQDFFPIRRREPVGVFGPIDVTEDCGSRIAGAFVTAVPLTLVL